MIIIKCKECGKKIETYPSRIGRKKFCSPKCRGKHNTAKFKIGHRWVGKLKVEKRKASNNRYIEIFSPHHPFKNKRNAVLEHRLIVEKYLGRFLLPNEVVHHKNGKTKDNHIENLEIITQSNHAQIHIKNRKRNSKGQLI